MNRNKILLGVLSVLLGTAALVFGVVVWQSSKEELVDTTHPEETAPALTPNERTALEAARIMTTWNPANDYNRTAAEQRAGHLMTDERADNIEAPERAASGKSWNDAARQGATSEPSVEINHFTETEAGVISVFATWEWVTEDDQVSGHDTEQRIYYFAFNDKGEIHDYTYETIRSSQGANS